MVDPWLKAITNSKYGNAGSELPANFTGTTPVTPARVLAGEGAPNDRLENTNPKDRTVEKTFTRPLHCSDRGTAPAPVTSPRAGAGNCRQGPLSDLVIGHKNQIQKRQKRRPQLTETTSKSEAMPVDQDCG